LPEEEVLGVSRLAGYGYIGIKVIAVEEKLLELSGFLSRSPRSYNEVSQFLSLRVLDDLSVVCLYVAELIETGVLCPLGSFGYESRDIANFQEVSLQQKTPMALAVSSNKVVIVANEVTTLQDFTVLEVMESNPDWKTLISVPAYPNGGFTFLSTKTFKNNEVDTLFLIAVGSLLGLYGQSIPPALVDAARLAKEQTNLEGFPLTQRQLVIAGMLERGHSNLEISQEIGFSESLIRQESVAIYQKLNVSGRKAMQAIHNLKLENIVAEQSDLESALIAKPVISMVERK
jgi:DNA-binding CsgD family transcriptional regulator